MIPFLLLAVGLLLIFVEVSIRNELIDLYTSHELFTNIRREAEPPVPERKSRVKSVESKHFSTN